MEVKQENIMKNTLCKKDRKGFVLSLVLWITAAMMLLSVLFIRMTKEETAIYKQIHYRTKLKFQTSALFEKLCFYAATGKFHQNTLSNRLDPFPKELKLDGTEYNVTQKGTFCQYSLFDQSGLFNLRFLLTPYAAQKLIEQSTGKAYPFQDIYLDWIDKYDSARLNGAEKNDYLLSGYKNFPPNYNAFQQRDAMKQLKDFNKFDENISKKIRQNFTTYGNVALNIMLLNRVRLQALFPQLGKNEITRLLTLQKEKPDQYLHYFTSSSYTQDVYGLFPAKVVRIIVKCQHKNVKTKIKAIIDFRATNAKSWAILEMYK